MARDRPKQIQWPMAQVSVRHQMAGESRCPQSRRFPTSESFPTIGREEYPQKDVVPKGMVVHGVIMRSEKVRRRIDIRQHRANHRVSAQPPAGAPHIPQEPSQSRMAFDVHLENCNETPRDSQLQGEFRTALRISLRVETRTWKIWYASTSVGECPMQSRDINLEPEKAPERRRMIVPSPIHAEQPVKCDLYAGASV